MTSPFQIGVTLTRVNDTNSPSQIIHVNSPSQGGSHLDVGKTLADAATRSNREGAEGALSEGNVVGGHGLASKRVDLVAQPPLGSIAIRNRVVVLVVVDSVVRSSDDSSLGEGVAVDGDAAGENFTGQDAADRGGQTHGFVDTGAEVGAGSESRAVDNLLDVAELVADFFRDALESVGIADEVEESRGHGGGSGV